MAFAAIIITILVLSPKNTGSEVFQTFTPTNALGHTGTLELVAAQVLIFYSFVASDSTARTFLPRGVPEIVLHLVSDIRHLLMSYVAEF